MVAYMFFLNSMAMLLVAFGLLSWGGIARIVRSETLQRREEGYVLSARAIGARDRYVLTRHLLPNVTNTVVPAAFHLIAILVLTEAGLAFIGFHASFQSWGMTISEGVFYGSTTAWWISAFPAITLGVTVIALKRAGDGFRDVLDPRGGL
jgi:peptide/nickel transport system permease protein